MTSGTTLTFFETKNFLRISIWVQTDPTQSLVFRCILRSTRETCFYGKILFSAIQEPSGFATMTIKRFVPRRSNMQKRLREIEEMRASLPLGKYLQLIHMGATTGVIPHIHPLTGEIADVAVTVVHDAEDEPRQILLVGPGSVLDADARLNLLKYLVDKQMPAMDLKSLEIASQSTEKEAAQLVESPQDSGHLEREALEQIISDAQFYVPEPNAVEPNLPPESELA